MEADGPAVTAKKPAAKGLGQSGPSVRGVTTRRGPGFESPEFVEQAFRQWCLLTDFNLDAFDTWLAMQPSTLATAELRDKRARAIEAFSRNPNDEAGILWHRDYMQARWRHLVALAAVSAAKPVLATGAKWRQAGDRGRQTRSMMAAKEAERLQEKAEKIWAADPSLSRAAVAKEIAPGRWDSVRKVLKKPGA